MLLSLFESKGNFYLTFLNTTFFVALFLFILGGFLFIIEKGFFNVFIYSSIKVGKFFNRKKEEIIEDEITKSDNKDILYRNYDFVITNPIFFSGLTLGIATTILSFLYIM